MGNKKTNRLTFILFVIYMTALVWIILFKLQFSLDITGHTRSINLIPFAGSLIINGKMDFGEIFDNLLIFVPFGIYICMLKPNWLFPKKILPVFLTSLILEVLQFILAMGATDITDLISNTTGGLAGIGFFFIFTKLFREKAIKFMSILAAAATSAPYC